jgi:Uma2 family endonuclease
MKGLDGQPLAFRGVRIGQVPSGRAILGSVSEPVTPRRAATLDDLARVRDGRAVEIIDGELVEKAMPSPAHGSAQLAVGAQLFLPFNRRSGGGGPGGWWLMTEVEVHYEDRQVYRHDLVGWRHATCSTRPSEIPVRVRPDWVCEILSPSNAGNDLVKKLRTLQRHAVPHYWLVDPENRTLTVLRWTVDGYLTALTAGDVEVVRAEPFEAIELRLELLFAAEERGE